MTSTVKPDVASRHSAGFTLVELLIAMGLTTAMMGSVMLIAGQLQRSYQSRLDNAAVQQEARYALDWISRELMAAGSNANTVTVSACPAAGTTFRPIRRDPDLDGVQSDIRIHADVNPPNGLLGGENGACTESNEDITIAFDAASRVITRRDNNVGAVATPMSDTVISQLLFAYLDASRVATTVDASVSFVRITVSAQTPRADYYTGQPTTFTLTTDVRLRAR
jgi:Tfp pilus assembly protein PilW